MVTRKPTVLLLSRRTSSEEPGLPRTVRRDKRLPKSNVLSLKVVLDAEDSSKRLEMPTPRDTIKKLIPITPY